LKGWNAMSERERLHRELRARIEALKKERDRLAAAVAAQTESGSVFTDEELRLIHASSNVRETFEPVDPVAKVGEALYWQLPPNMRTNKQARRFGRLSGLVSGYVFGQWLGGLLFPDDK